MGDLSHAIFVPNDTERITAMEYISNQRTGKRRWPK